MIDNCNNKYDQVYEYNHGVAIVRKGDKYGAIMIGGREIIPPIYDGLTYFEDGLAKATLKISGAEIMQEEHVINMSGQVQVRVKEEFVFLPVKYDWGVDTDDDSIIVVSDGKFGIVDCNLEEKVSTVYDCIVSLSKNLFIYHKDKKYGFINLQDGVISAAEYDSIELEESYLKVSVVSEDNFHYGIIDGVGNIIVPIMFDKIDTHSDSLIYWEVKKNTSFGVNREPLVGIYTTKGCLIPCVFHSIRINDSNMFECFNRDINRYYCNLGQFDLAFSVFCDYHFNGRMTCHSVDLDYEVPPGYQMAYYAGHGLIRVLKDGKWGIMNSLRKIIVEPQYTYIDEFKGSFAIVGNNDNDTVEYFITVPNHYGYNTKKYGLIDTYGTLVVPIDYDQIVSLEDGFYSIQKDGLWGVLSPTLSIIVEPKYKSIELFEHRGFIVSEPDEYLFGLIDLWGNVILKPGTFEKIENFGNSLYKATCFPNYSVDIPEVTIYNKKGTYLFGGEDCDDVKLINDGFAIVSIYSGRTEYNIVNIQGKELLPSYCKRIKHIIGDLYSIEGYGGWGILSLTRGIICQPMYCDELHFEDGVARIFINGGDSSKKITSSGHVLVMNEGNEVKLPKRYYWGADFHNGISIVREYINKKLGVIDKNNQEIIPTIFDQIDYYSNDTLLVKKGNCYGLYRTDGTIILPAFFWYISYINDNRLRVFWNTQNGNYQDNVFYTEGINEPYHRKNDVSKCINDRSAICDLNGKIVNEIDIVRIWGRIIAGLVVSKKSQYYDEEQNKIVYKKTGIIDINGHEILPHIYDDVVINETYSDESARFDSCWEYHIYKPQFAVVKKDDKYGYFNIETQRVSELKYDELVMCSDHYAKICLGDIYGILDLRTGQEKIYEGVNIIKILKCDRSGRFVYAVGKKYDNEANDYIYKQGVLSFDGIVVEATAYNTIELLDNGQIRILDEYEYPIRLLDCKGNEIEDNAELVVPDDDSSGVEESREFVQIPSRPKEIISEKIYEKSSSFSQLPYFDTSEDYSERRYYNGYDADAIREAFDGDPELTWNVD